jgi:hypothetical protein
MGKTITVGCGDYQDQTNEVLQRAVDTVAAAGGGTVEIPAGTYRMQDALHLRDNVRVVGEEDTVLLKEPSVSSPLDGYLGYGFYEFAVKEPDKFRVGMGVHLTDDDAGGFYTTVATIIARRGDYFLTDRMLHHDYQERRNGRVISVFPLVEGYGISDASVENLTLDGNPEETVTLNGCRGGGVFLLQSRNVRLEGVEVRHYNGDGISFQQCVDIRVCRCHVHDSRGTGLHPGSGSVRYLLEGNHVHHNGGDGIFYCLRTTHSDCVGNQIKHNGRAGISIGERDSDHWIHGNTIVDNQRQGIYFRRPVRHGGDRVRIEENTIGPNCQGEAEHEIWIESGLEDVTIAANTIQPGKGKALSVAPECTRIYFRGNCVAGRPQESADVSGPSGAACCDAPAMSLSVGPLALPLDGAQHLHIAYLPAWTEDSSMRR